MKLRQVGFFQELDHGNPDGPKLVDSISCLLPDEQEMKNYLRSGIVFIGCPGVVSDVLDETAGPIADPSILTDGEWAWPGDLPYYLEKYHVALPNEFVQHVRQKKFRLPDYNHLDLSTLEL